jgi:DNA (cytosine-5)-methyltransferase 1
MTRSKGEGLTVAGLFAGIGGIESGLHQAGHRTELLCEIDPGAVAVLKAHFPGVPVSQDVRTIKSLPRVDMIAAGFPCQDLSQAGRTAGIRGNQSSLVGEVFGLLGNKRSGPRWLLLENVPFMLQLQRGRAMRYLVDELEEREFRWAYRVVDTRAFGVPQRRKRVLLLASRSEDPRLVLFGVDAGESLPSFSPRLLCGFYWTEGLRGLGWAVDAVPTLKGGSAVGIPSPPGIWNPATGEIMTPDIRDAERLQGFRTDWTLPALDAAGVRRGHRWKLMGNAVSVPVARWVGERLMAPTDEAPPGELLKRGMSWPTAAWGEKGRVYSVAVSAWPVRMAPPHLKDFLRFPTALLSARAAAGFHSRALISGLKFEDGFLNDVKRHAERMARSKSAA